MRSMVKETQWSSRTERWNSQFQGTQTWQRRGGFSRRSWVRWLGGDQTKVQRKTRGKSTYMKVKMEKLLLLRRVTQAKSDSKMGKIKGWFKLLDKDNSWAQMNLKKENSSNSPDKTYFANNKSFSNNLRSSIKTSKKVERGGIHVSILMLQVLVPK